MSSDGSSAGGVSASSVPSYSGAGIALSDGIASCTGSSGIESCWSISSCSAICCCCMGSSGIATKPPSAISSAACSMGASIGSSTALENLLPFLDTQRSKSDTLMFLRNGFALITSEDTISETYELGSDFRTRRAPSGPRKCAAYKLPLLIGIPALSRILAFSYVNCLIARSCWSPSYRSVSSKLGYLFASPFHVLDRNW